jgi:eukaryotic-like serine/threonine-protein kinase
MPDDTEAIDEAKDIFAVTGSDLVTGRTSLQTQIDHSPRPESGRSRVVGERFGDFLILRELGRGGFATVYLAHDVTLDRRVALKISDGCGLGERGEGQALAELEHDNIVQVHAQFTDAASGKHCLCLQYVPGTTLARVIAQLHKGGWRPERGEEILDVIAAETRDEVPFDPAGLRNRQMLAASSFAAAVCRVGVQLAEALQFAHRRGVLHCDIKPANVLINPYGRPMLADFNVAIDAERTHPGKCVGGTVAYMSPEQLSVFLREGNQRIDERSDIYSLGILLFEFLTGHGPFDLSACASPPDLLRREQAFGTAVIWEKEHLPPVVERVLRRCLEPAPERRYTHAGEFAQSLANAFDLLTVETSLPAGGPVTARALRWPIAMLIVLTLLPQVAGSIVNIAYNAIEIRLGDAQQKAFANVVLAYNLIVYPIAIAILLRLAVPVVRLWKTIDVSGAMKGEEVDLLRRKSLRLGTWGIILALAGWLPGGLIFPLAIDAQAGPLAGRVYAEFIVSFTLSGLIALIYSHFGIQFIVLRIIYPRLGNADSFSRDAVRNELDRASRWFTLFQSLATVVPLVGAVLLVAVTGYMTLSFRLLITGLIILGMVGVGVAFAVTRRLHRIVRLLQGELT